MENVNTTNLNTENESETTESTQVESTVRDAKQTEEVDSQKQEDTSDELFTQSQVNKIVAKRVKEVKKTYEDYDAIKAENNTLKDKIKTLEEQKETVVSKLTDKEFDDQLKIVSDEMNANFKLASKLINRDSVVYEDGKPTNLKELMKDIVTEYPNVINKVQVQTTPTTKTESSQSEEKFSLNPVKHTNFFGGGGVRLPSNFVKIGEK